MQDNKTRNNNNQMKDSASTNNQQNIHDDDVEYKSSNWNGHDYTQFNSDIADKHAKSLASCCDYLLLVMGLSLYTVKLNHATDIP